MVCPNSSAQCLKFVHDLHISEMHLCLLLAIFCRVDVPQSACFLGDRHLVSQVFVFVSQCWGLNPRLLD